MLCIVSSIPFTFSSPLPFPLFLRVVSNCLFVGSFLFLWRFEFDLSLLGSWPGGRLSRDRVGWVDVDLASSVTHPFGLGKQISGVVSFFFFSIIIVVTGGRSILNGTKNVELLRTVNKGYLDNGLPWLFLAIGVTLVGRWVILCNGWFGFPHEFGQNVGK